MNRISIADTACESFESLRGSVGQYDLSVTYDPLSFDENFPFAEL